MTTYIGPTKAAIFLASTATILWTALRALRPMLLAIAFCGQAAYATEKQFRVIGIHSYTQDFPWTRMLITSFERTLRGNSLPGFKSPVERTSVAFEHYFLDEKGRQVRVSGDPLKEIERLKKHLAESRPDLVYLTDDYATGVFAGWLADVKIPFVFAGVNGDAPNLAARGTLFSGVLERYYVRESVELLQRSLRKKRLKMLVMLEDSVTSRPVRESVTKVAADTPDIDISFLETNDFDAWAKALESSDRYDALLPLQPYGVRRGASQIPVAEMVETIVARSKVPTVFTSDWHIACGGTLAVTQRPNAQGYYAAAAARDILFKVAPPQAVVPPHGSIEINMESSARFGMNIPFDILSYSHVVRTTQKRCNP